jgi:glycosyltransferase involved in cell wall biosynthesis
MTYSVPALTGHPVHLMPGDKVSGAEELTIVIPALNEELTIGEFVDWCKEGLAAAGVPGQILIVDSSTDGTPQIALQHGAEVLRTPARGLGRAYIDAIPFIRGKWIVMGDADLTYDFRELAPFVQQFRNGVEFVMGSRFRGSIEAGSMPRLHRYFGTPLTTWLLNRIYHSGYSDIHCGMRGLTRAALDKINLRSQSWEYASEMVLKAARLQLRTGEVPVRFYKDRAGRVSHHKRLGWLSPWIAGWLNLKAMLVYTPDSFLLKPGLAIMAVGLVLSFALAGGPFRIGRIVFSLYWMLLGLTLTTLGYSCVQIGILSRKMHRLRPGFVRSFERILNYDRGMLLACLCGCAGVCLAAVLVWRYVQHGWKLESLSYSAILGLLLIILGFQTFAFTLLMEMARRILDERHER